MLESKAFTTLIALVSSPAIPFNIAVISSLNLSPVVYEEIKDGHIFTMQLKLLQKLLCINWGRQCANGELLQI